MFIKRKLLFFFKEKDENPRSEFVALYWEAIVRRNEQMLMQREI